MALASWDRDLALLERDLKTLEYQVLLINLQRQAPFLRKFESWAEVVAFMHRGSSPDPRKDEVLRPILAAHASDDDHRWRTILLVIFWPALVSICRRKRHWDRDDPLELWQRTFWAFHESICRIDPGRRRDRLAQWIYNATFHRLYEGYARDWTRAGREPCTDPEDIGALAGGIDGIDFAGMELREHHQRAIERLRGHREAGRISETDFLLIVGTRLYGQSIPEYARGAGLRPEAAKKRRQRAEAAICRYENEMQ